MNAVRGEAADGVEFDIDDGVCILTLRNPRRRNAISTRMMSDLEDAYRTISSSPTIRSVLLHGEGTDFCAGADIDALSELSGIASARDHIERFRRLYQGLFEVRQPTVCAVSGYALGAGLELCLAADIAVVDDSAKLGVPEAKLGAVPGYAMVQLQASVGRTRALDLMLTGRMLDAAEAVVWGLATRNAGPESSFGVALDLAKLLAAGAPIAQSIIKRTVARTVSEADWQLFVTGSSSALSSRDASRGMQAFLDRADPTFEGT